MNGKTGEREHMLLSQTVASRPDGTVPHETGAAGHGQQPAFDWQTEPASRVVERERLKRAAGRMIQDPGVCQPGDSNQLAGQNEWNHSEWACRIWKPTEHRPPQKPGRAGVTTFARRLMAMERSRATHGKPVQFSTHSRGRSSASEGSRFEAPERASAVAELGGFVTPRTSREERGW